MIQWAAGAYGKHFDGRFGIGLADAEEPLPVGPREAR